MCRSIKTLRPPYAEAVTSTDIRAAALQYVRKVSGFHRPAAHNAAAFERAAAAIEQATTELLDTLEVRGTPRPQVYQSNQKQADPEEHVTVATQAG